MVSGTSDHWVRGGTLLLKCLTCYKIMIFFFIFMSLNQLSIPFLLKIMLDFSTFAKHIE